MDRLYTPWRRAFIEGTSTSTDHRPTDCFLCDLASDATNDRKNLVLYRASTVFVLLNLYPYNSGHLMIAPYLHSGDLATLPGDIAAEMMHLTQRTVGTLQQAYHPDAFNTGMNLGKAAGAGVPDHLHVHVVPRWNGDTSYMPVIADTKVLPETLDQTYERLEPYFRNA